MAVYGCVWLCMAMYGYVGMCVAICVWLCRAVYGYVELCMTLYGYVCRYNFYPFLSFCLFRFVRLYHFACPVSSMYGYVGLWGYVWLCRAM